MASNVHPDPTNTQELNISAELEAALKVPTARLVCVNPQVLRADCGHIVIPLETRRVSIGRASSNDVVLEASGVSRTHAELCYADQRWQIKDTGSSNGVMVNKSSTKQQSLWEGDVISIGTVHYKFSLDSTGELVGDSEHQVSLFDVEKTMVVSKEGLELESHVASTPKPKVAPKLKAAPKLEVAPEPTVVEAPSGYKSKGLLLGAVAVVTAVTLSLIFFV